MNKSFIERLFPHAPSSRFPQHEQAEPLVDRFVDAPPTRSRIQAGDSVATLPLPIANRRIPSRRSSNTSKSPSSETNSKPSAAPLSASVVHHHDPFLPVERAARALQDTIQSLLDAQSRGLAGRVNGEVQDGAASIGSLTPTQSIITPRSSTRTGVIPIRQPQKRKITLPAARKGLTRKMHEFAELKKEELHILDTESTARDSALQHLNELEARREACRAEIDSIRSEETSTTASKLRSEAQNVQSDIEELEHRLLELRVRHRHLLSQADQIDSSLESKASSFKGTLSMIDRETRDFLRRPPVTHALSSPADTNDKGMYALKPERRTLEMAKSQWMSEQDHLVQRRECVEKERTALLEGEQVWCEAIQSIDQFEQHLRAQTTLLTQTSAGPEDGARTSMQTVLTEMDSTVNLLEEKLSVSESNNWNLLICAIGAELEAFYQAREMLKDTQDSTQDHRTQEGQGTNEDLQTDYLSDSLFHGMPPSLHGSTGSNQSLKDTLHEFSGNPRPESNARDVGVGIPKYESEDDEPPADFLLSH